MSVVLIGYRGSGKTTTGRKLADRLWQPFVDTDDLVVQKAGKSIREIFEHYGPGAEAAGCALLTALGYDWVPGNLAGALALRDAGPDAVRVDVGYFMTGKFGLDAVSGGTRASAAGVMVEPSFAWRGGRLVAERGAARLGSFAAGGGHGARQGISVGGSEHIALPRVHAGLREVNVYLGGPGPRAMQGASAAIAALGRIPGVRGGMGALAAKAIKGSTGGPDAAARSRTGSLVLAEARSAAGDVLARVRLEGANVYEFTGRMLAWAAERAAAGALTGTGALGPVDGFGLDELERGVADSGISRVA